MLKFITENFLVISLIFLSSIMLVTLAILLFTNKGTIFDLIQKIHANDKGEQSWSRWANTIVILFTFILTYIQALRGVPLSDSIILGLIGMTLGAKVVHKQVEKNQNPLK